jgi:ABC-type bacteriocin/lantibiotic exporter with double-glycine peptidase domain
MLKIFPAGFKWLALVFLTVVRAFLEMAGLALFVPLLLLLLEEDGISKNEWLNRVYTGLNIDSFGSFLLLICGVVLLFTLLKNLALHKINNHQNRSLLKIFSHYSESLFTRYYNKGLLFIKESSSHALSHNTNSVCYSYVFGVLSPAISLVGDLILAILIVASLAYVNIYIALIEVILFIPFVLFYQMKIGGELQRAGKCDNEAKKNQWRVTIETFRGYAEVEVKV